jgi:hypothetical protein
MKSLSILAILLLAVSSFNRVLAQGSTKHYNKIFSFPDKLLSSIDHKSAGCQEKLAHQTDIHCKTQIQTHMSTSSA